MYHLHSEAKHRPARCSEFVYSVQQTAIFLAYNLLKKINASMNTHQLRNSVDCEYLNSDPTLKM